MTKHNPNRRTFYVYAIIFGLLATAQGFSNRGYYLDDAFIFLRVGRNLAENASFAFNVGSRINCSTSFLNPLFAALAHIMPGNPILIMHIVNDAFFGGAAIVLLHLFAEKNNVLAGFICGLAILADPLIHMTYGMETGLTILLSLAALAFMEKDDRFCGLLMGLAILARPDTVLFVLIILSYMAVTRRSFPIKAVLFFLIPVLPWLVFSIVYWGSPFPQTLSAKMAQGASGFWKDEIMFLPGLITQLDDFYPFPWNMVMALFVALGAWKLYRERSVLILVFLWAILHVIAYCFLGVPGYHWYYALVFLVLDISIGGAAWLVYDLFLKVVNSRYENKGRRAQILAAILCIVVLAPAANTVRKSTGLDLPPRERAYKEMGLWIKENTEKHETIAAIEIGTVGYYSERPVVDPLGMVADSDMAESMKEAYKGGWVEKLKPDIIIIHRKIWPIEMALVNSEVQRNYEPMKLFEFPRYRNMVVLRRTRQ